LFSGWKRWKKGPTRILHREKKKKTDHTATEDRDDPPWNYGNPSGPGFYVSVWFKPCLYKEIEILGM